MATVKNNFVLTERDTHSNPDMRDPHKSGHTVRHGYVDSCPQISVQLLVSGMATDLLWRCGVCLRASPSPSRPREGERLRAERPPRAMVFTVPLGLFCICWGWRGKRLRRGEATGEGERERSSGSLLTFRLLSLLERSSTRGAASVLLPWCCTGVCCSGLLRPVPAGASRKGTGRETEKKR